MSRLEGVLLYMALAVLGWALYFIAHDYATELRGYTAYGGEVFFIAIPCFATYRIFVHKPKKRKEDHHAGCQRNRNRP
jgi:hypothetical protein